MLSADPANVYVRCHGRFKFNIWPRECFVIRSLCHTKRPFPATLQGYPYLPWTTALAKDIVLALPPVVQKAFGKQPLQLITLPFGLQVSMALWSLNLTLIYAHSHPNPRQKTSSATFATLSSTNKSMALWSWAQPSRHPAISQRIMLCQSWSLFPNNKISTAQFRAMFSLCSVQRDHGIVAGTAIFWLQHQYTRF